jgi:hypothetical protein
MSRETSYTAVYGSAERFPALLAKQHVTFRNVTAGAAFTALALVIGFICTTPIVILFGF